MRRLVIVGLSLLVWCSGCSHDDVRRIDGDGTNEQLSAPDSDSLQSSPDTNVAIADTATEPESQETTTRDVTSTELGDQPQSESDETLETALPQPGHAVTSATGIVYHSTACSGSVDGNVVIFLPGTTLSPTNYTTFVTVAGNATGTCVIAVPYFNAFTNGNCCTVNGDPDGPQNADCLVAEYAAKVIGDPSSFTCVDGKSYTVGGSTTIEDRIAAALVELGLTGYYQQQGAAISVRWDKLVLSGHSQGAQLSMYIGTARHELAGLALFAGGIYLLADGNYESWAYLTPMTPPSRFFAFHHINDGDSTRRDRYKQLGIPDQNIRTTDIDNPKCQANAHSCVITDYALARTAGGDEPAVLADWLWILNATQP